MPRLQSDHRHKVKNTDPVPTAIKPRALWIKVALAIVVLAALVVGLNRVFAWALNLVGTMNTIADSHAFNTAMAIALLLYGLLIAAPFMPGIEVGIALLLLRGAEIAPFVYLATVSGLMTAFAAGRWVPLRHLSRISEGLNLRRVSALLTTLETTAPADRLAAQRARLPTWLAKLTVDYRYATLGVLLNVPGTFAIGGGGGILMAAGFSRLFNGWLILATLLIATAPVPLTVWIIGRAAVGN